MPACSRHSAPACRRRARGQCWALLMRRTFGFDVLALSSLLRLLAMIEEAQVIARILRHLGMPTEIPAARPARAPPLPAGVTDVAGWCNDSSSFDPVPDFSSSLLPPQRPGGGGRRSARCAPSRIDEEFF